MKQTNLILFALIISCTSNLLLSMDPPLPARLSIATQDRPTRLHPLNDPSFLINLDPASSEFARVLQQLIVIHSNPQESDLKVLMRAFVQATALFLNPNLRQPNNVTLFNIIQKYREAFFERIARSYNGNRNETALHLHTLANDLVKKEEDSIQDIEHRQHLMLFSPVIFDLLLAGQDDIEPTQATAVQMGLGEDEDDFSSAEQLDTVSEHGEDNFRDGSKNPNKHLQLQRRGILSRLMWSLLPAAAISGSVMLLEKPILDTIIRIFGNLSQDKRKASGFFTILALLTGGQFVCSQINPVHDRLLQPLIPTASLAAIGALCIHFKSIDKIFDSLEAAMVRGGMNDWKACAALFTLISAAGTLGYEGVKEVVSTIYEALSKKDGHDESSREL
jgi:hypothetical protein